MNRLLRAKTGFGIMELVACLMIGSLTIFFVGKLHSSVSNQYFEMETRRAVNRELKLLLTDVSRNIQRRAAFNYLPIEVIQSTNPQLTATLVGVANNAIFNPEGVFPCQDLKLYHTRSNPNDRVGTVTYSTTCDTSANINYSPSFFNTLPPALRCPNTSGGTPRIIVTRQDDALTPLTTTTQPFGGNQHILGMVLCARVGGAGATQIELEAGAIHRKINGEYGFTTQRMTVPLNYLTANIEILPP